MSTKHTAGSNECLKHYRENVALNKFIIEFMVGEGIAQSPCAVLGVRQAEGLTGNDILIDEDEIIDNNEQIMDKIHDYWLIAQTPFKEIDSMKTKINTNEEHFKKKLSVLKMEVNARIENMEKRTEKIQKTNEEIAAKNDLNQASNNELLQLILRSINK